MAITRQAFTSGIFAWTATANAAGTTIIPGGASAATDLLLPGDVLVMGVSMDNLSATTPTFTLASLPSQVGSWTQQRQSARQASANAGLAVALWTATVISAASSMTFPTITASGSVNAKACLILALRGASETLRGTLQEAGGLSTTPSVTSASATTGDVVVGFCGVEQNSTPSAFDTDSTNGNWDTNTTFASSSGGGSAANQTVTAQTKVVTGSGTQTYNLTTGNTDWIAYALVLQPAAEGRPWEKGGFVRKSGLFVQTPRTLVSPVGV